MRKILWLFLSLVALLMARENPFEMSMSSKNVGQTTHVKDERVDFNSTTLILPSSARILKSASVTFQNLDGSISEEVVAIDQNVDWHYPLLLSSQSSETKTTPLSPAETKKSVEKKVVTAPALPLLKEEKKEVVSMNSMPVEANFKLNEQISFFIQKNEITIFTKETKIRDFLIGEPYKIVLDFKKVTAYNTKSMEFKKAPFISATLGDHDGFYRIAILLDGHYRYDLQPFSGGYIVKLK